MVDRIVRTYLVITGLFNLAMSLIWGINTLFLMDAGLDIFEVMLVNAAYTVGAVVFEVPTGVVADTVGRRISLLLSFGTLFVATLLYVTIAWRGWGFGAFCAASVLIGLGYTFLSGALEAWLVDALKAAGHEGPLEPIFARGQTVFGVAMLIGSVSGGLLGQAHLYLPYLVRAGIVVPLFVVTWRSMVELGFTPRALELRRVPAEMRRVFGEGMKRGVRHPVLRWMVWTTFVSTSFGIFGYYSWQRYFLDLLGHELVWVSGLISAAFALSGIVGNRLVKRIAVRLPSRTGYLAVMISLQAAMIVACGLAGSFAVAVGCYLVYAVVMGASTPVKQAYLNAHIPSEHRATLLSLDSFYGSIGGTIGQSGWGWYSRERTIAGAWVRAGVCLVLGVPFFLLARRADRRTTGGAAPADRFG